MSTQPQAMQIPANLVKELRERTGAGFADCRAALVESAADIEKAIDVLKDGKPDPAGRDEIVQAAFRRGLLLLGCGEYSLRFCPPLCVTAAQVDTGLQLLNDVLPAAPAEK